MEGWWCSLFCWAGRSSEPAQAGMPVSCAEWLFSVCLLVTYRVCLCVSCPSLPCGLWIHFGEKSPASSREAVSRTVVGRVSHCTPKPGIHDGRLACSDLRLASCGLQEEGWVVVRCLPTHVDLSLSHWLSRGATVDGRHTRRSGSPMARDTDLGIGTSLWERSVLRKPETPAGGLSSQGSLATRRRGHTH